MAVGRWAIGSSDKPPGLAKRSEGCRAQSSVTILVPFTRGADAFVSMASGRLLPARARQCRGCAGEELGLGRMCGGRDLGRLPVKAAGAEQGTEFRFPPSNSAPCSIALPGHMPSTAAHSGGQGGWQLGAAAGPTANNKSISVSVRSKPSRARAPRPGDHPDRIQTRR